MKKLIIILTAVLTVSFTACAEQTDSASQSPSGNNSSMTGDLGAFPIAFSAKDLYDNDVTEASLGEKEIFFVHYWATWCGPCVTEMPDIAEVAEKYGDRVGFLGLLDDYSDNRQGAVNIKESSGVNFITVDANTQGLEGVLAMLRTGYVPTTVILDRNCDMIGEAIIGAHGAGYAQFLDAALD